MDGGEDQTLAYEREVRDRARSAGDLFGGVERTLKGRNMSVRERPEPAPVCTQCPRRTVPLRAPWGGWMLPPLCPVCQEAADREELREIESQRSEAARAGALRQAGLSDAEQAALRTIGQGALLAQLSGLERSKGAILWSRTPGTGKTTQLQLLVALMVTRRRSARYVTQHELLEALKPGAPASPVDWTRVEVLALDELGGSSLTEWAADQLLHVIDQRYRNRLSTVVATNHRIEDLGAHPDYGGRIVSRLQERGEVVQMSFNYRTGRKER